MAKRLSDTDKWNDDWYLSLNNDYRIIWQWLLDKCNHAGICRRSIQLLNMDCKTQVTEDQMIEIMDGRVIVLDNKWFIPKFLCFQYNDLTSNRAVIVSAIKELKKGSFYKHVEKIYGKAFFNG